jgi:hypothetical protein
MPGKNNGPDEPISMTLASANLKLDRKSLREWKNQKLKILRMKKGAKRWRGQSIGGKPLLEFNLHKKFVIERGWKDYLVELVYEACKGNISRSISSSILSGRDYWTIQV